MTQATLASIIEQLNAAGVRYLIAGGLAVVAHGHVRYTADVDIILSLDPVNVELALQVLKKLDYRPRAPVPIEEFADPAKRQQWQTDKGLKAFSLYSPSHPETEVDLFINDPLGFENAYARGMFYPFAEGLDMPVCGLADLIHLKQQASRPKDLDDIRALRQLFPDVP
jgi:hypothetical protein